MSIEMRERREQTKTVGAKLPCRLVKPCYIVLDSNSTLMETTTTTTVRLVEYSGHLPSGPHSYPTTSNR